MIIVGRQRRHASFGTDGAYSHSAPPSLPVPLPSSLSPFQTDLLLFLTSHEAVQTFTRRSQISAGTEVSIAVGPSGRTAASEVYYRGGREGVKEGGRLEAGFCYGQSRGAFVGVSVEGTLLFSRDRVNEKFYGKRSVTVRELLNGDTAPPTAAEPLYQALREVMGMEGQGKAGEEPDLQDGGKVRERREKEGEEEGEDEEEEEEGERRWRNMEKNAEMKTFRVSHELRQTDEDKARDHLAAEPKTEGAGGAREEEEEEEVVLM